MVCEDVNASDPFSGYSARQVFYADSACIQEVTSTDIVPAQDARQWQTFCAGAGRASLALLALLLAFL